MAHTRKGLSPIFWSGKHLLLRKRFRSLRHNWTGPLEGFTSQRFASRRSGIQEMCANYTHVSCKAASPRERAWPRTGLATIELCSSGREFLVRPAEIAVANKIS
jgi:hypothetical protein